MITLTIQGLPSITSNGPHGHWKAKWANSTKWKRLVAYALSGKLPRKPFKLAHVVMTRHSSHEPDFDNLAISFKPIMDGLVQAGVLIGDKASQVRVEYKWAKAKQHKGFITIEVREIADKPKEQSA